MSGPEIHKEVPSHTITSNKLQHDLSPHNEDFYTNPQLTICNRFSVAHSKFQAGSLYLHMHSSCKIQSGIAYLSNSSYLSII